MARDAACPRGKIRVLYKKYINAVKDIIMLDEPNHRGAYLGVSGEGRW